MLSLNVSPFIFRLGYFQIGYYLLAYILGFLVALFFLFRAIKKKEINITKGQAYDLIITALFGVVIGARIFHIVFWNFDYYLSNLIKIFYIWQGGFSLHGGIAGGAVSLYVYCKVKKINIAKLAGILALPSALGLAIGRITCFINQDIVGTLTTVPWCFKFAYNSGCRHPVTLYASLGYFILFFILLIIKKSNLKLKPGFLFWIFITLAGTGRFFTDFLRENAIYLGLRIGQWFSLVLIIVGGIVLIKYYRKDISNLFKLV